MIIKLVNERSKIERFYDCRNSEIRWQHLNSDDSVRIRFLTLDLIDGKSIAMVLSTGDCIYYLNSYGKIVDTDYTMVNK